MFLLLKISFLSKGDIKLKRGTSQSHYCKKTKKDALGFDHLRIIIEGETGKKGPNNLDRSHLCCTTFTARGIFIALTHSEGLLQTTTLSHTLQDCLRNTLGQG